MHCEPKRGTADECLSAALSINSYLSDYIKLADTKAGVLSGFMAALLWVLLDQEVADPFWKGGIACCAGAALVAIGMCLRVVWPRTPKAKRGFIFWENILSHGSSAKYSQAFTQLCPHEVSDEVLNQNYNLASVAKMKYSCLREAFSVCVFVAAVSVLVLLAASMLGLPAPV